MENLGPLSTSKKLLATSFFTSEQERRTPRTWYSVTGYLLSKSDVEDSSIVFSHSSTLKYWGRAFLNGRENDEDQRKKIKKLLINYFI